MMKFGALFHKVPQQNHEGGEAFAMSPEMELYTAVVTSSLSPMFYEGIDERVARISSLVAQCEPEFVAQLAVYARNTMNLRSIPLLLVVELAPFASGTNLLSRTIESVVLRADEITELLACYQWRNPNPVAGKPEKQLARLPKQMQKGLQQVFNKFDEYQFAKYDNKNSEVRLRDALFLVHPKAKNTAQQALFDKIASESLETPYTWETEFSALGQQAFDSTYDKELAFSRKWTELVMSGKLGYMALLRNLRNILSAQSIPQEVVKAVVEKLADPVAVANSRQLPFRFLSAYREIGKISSTSTSTVLEALEKAVQYSAKNISGFGPDTRVVIASDVSGSMMATISPRSSVRLYDIGLMLSMLLRNQCKQVVSGIFGDTWKEIDLPRKHILANVQELYKREGEVGYSTNGHKVLEDLTHRHIVADKVLMFTDGQMWDSESCKKTLQGAWHTYKEKVAPNAKIYIFDLAGYGQSPLSVAEQDVYLIAGWNEKVFDMLSALENGNSVLSKIRSTCI